MPKLSVHHLAASDPPQFQIIREPSGDRSPPLRVPPADGFPIAGRPRSDLLGELRWYLERFLDYPFPPATDRAERVLKALRRWGETAFEALFAGRRADLPERDSYPRLRLEIRSDDPRVLSWPWEALRDPQAGTLGRLAQVERRLTTDLPTPSVAPELPSDQINILLVTARPGTDPGEDVAYRSSSRPLVELIAERKLAARVHALRPPTLARLADHLRERPATYHVLHFDGHGTYGRGSSGEGRLVFEDEAGRPEHVPGTILAALLRRSRVPVVVLNACRSATLEGAAADVFASIATSLLEAGVSSVVAMAYELYASASEIFLPAFYRSLFDTANVAKAVRAGRRRLVESPGRICVRGRFPLQDWLVPVLYRARDVALPAVGGRVSRMRPITAPLELPGVSAGFVDRDGEILDLERALRRQPAAIMIRGLWGVGKTALLRQFVEWLHRTEGLGEGCFWLDCDGIRTAEEIFGPIGRRLIGSTFAGFPVDEKGERLAAALRGRRFLIVWDHFETVAGNPEARGKPALSPADRRRLLAFLRSLRGGDAKVLIASTRIENWLGGECQDCGVIIGLRRTARWACCEQLLRDVGGPIDRDDEDLAALVDLLAGHPQAMRMMVPALGRYPARRLREALHHDLDDLDFESDATFSALKAKVLATVTSLPAELGLLLIPLSLHRRILATEQLEIMAQRAAPSLTGAPVQRFTSFLATAGLLQDWGPALYYLHPALIGLLRPAVLRRYDRATTQRWSEAFVTVMAALAEDFAAAPVGEQREIFEAFQDNFNAALSAADRLRNRLAQIALLQALASYLYNMGDLTAAEKLFEHLVAAQRGEGDLASEAAAYHMLGSIAQDRNDLEGAEAWYRRSIAIEEELQNDKGIAKTCHMLGNLAFEQGALEAAERRYRRALAIWETLDADSKAAETCHMLGTVALQNEEFEISEEWYRKALLKAADEDVAAATHQMLGSLALEQRDVRAARGHYLRALRINEELEADAEVAGVGRGRRRAEE